MSNLKSQMRLFNGHLKLDEVSLKKVFMMQLDNIYCIKSYLAQHLLKAAAAASFKDLKNAILESVDDIKLQLLCMDVIYDQLNEQHSSQRCISIEVLTNEMFTAMESPGLTNLERDLVMINHLNMIGSLELSCSNSLHDLALSMPESDLIMLLKQNLDLCKDCKDLYEMIMKEYVH